ncbi:MAG TPA: SDR family oxidoreductase [Alphaproteobacteria bacterium]
MAGKIAIVTGAGQGIGAVTAALFSAEGAKVLLVDQSAETLAAAAASIRNKQPDATLEILAADITEETAADRAVGLAVDKFGGLSVLVNNAAVRDVAPVAAADPAEWERVLTTNVVGTVRVCRAALPALKRSGHGSIVTVSSCYAVRGRTGFAAYDASKAALLAVTRSLAAEAAPHGVRANAVCPGGTLTPFTIGRASARGRSEPQMRAEPKADALLARWAEPIEIAYPILWLASDEASYITGTVLMVDGGSP